MRIIGGRDYYDRAMALGHDTRTVFVRETGRQLADRDLIPINSIHVCFADPKKYRQHVCLSGRSERFNYQSTLFTTARLAVIFCGKIHRGVQITQEPEAGGECEVTCYWEMAKLADWLDKLGLTMSLVRRMGSPLNAALFGTETVDDKLLARLIADKIVHAIRFPQSLYASDIHSWEINSDRLRDVQFFRKLNAFQAFQEIEMWVSGVLPGQTNAMETIPDEVRLVKHGFDKTSFRRPKQA